MRDGWSCWPRASQRQVQLRCRGAAGLSARHRRGACRGLAHRAGAGGPQRPARRDHRPRRAQDGHQRAQRPGAAASWPTSRIRCSPTWENLIRGQMNLRDAVRRTHQLTRIRPRARSTGSTSAPRRSSCGRAAGTCRRSTCASTASRSPARCSTSRCSSPTTTQALARRGTGPYFYLPKMESHLEARLWNDVFLARPGRARHAARHHQGDGADRDDPRGLRDGRDPVRAARALRGAELRPLGLHLQLHQEIQEPARISCCPTAPRDHGPALPASPTSIC